MTHRQSQDQDIGRRAGRGTRRGKIRSECSSSSALTSYRMTAKGRGGRQDSHTRIVHHVSQSLGHGWTVANREGQTLKVSDESICLKSLSGCTLKSICHHPLPLVLASPLSDANKQYLYSPERLAPGTAPPGSQMNTTNSSGIT